MLIESWDTDYLADQENVFGRSKDHRRPARPAGTSSTPPTSPPRARTARRSSPPTRTSGWPRPASNGGQKILRRGYSYTDGIDPSTGLLDAGLFFIAYQKDPRTQFVPIQQPARAARRCSTSTSGTPAARCSPCRPGCRGPGDCYGKALFG